MTTLVRVDAYVAEAYANWSRWVSRCGLCPWAKTLQRFEPHIECPLCGTVTEIIWPAEDMVSGIERLLLMRPDPSTRNWVPGESLSDLMTENGLHGIFDQLIELGLADTPGRALLSVEPDRIVTDKLPALKPRVRKEIA